MTRESRRDDDLRGEEVMLALGRARTTDVDPACADRIRRRCHGALRNSRRRPSWEAVGGALVATVCAIYLAEVVKRALELFGS